jgi:hypothetical protein
MNSYKRALTLAAVAAVGTTTAFAATAPKITPSGVGGVKLGKTYKQLHDAGLVGKLHHGCELSGPNTRSATLKSPLKGEVNFTLSSPRKAADMTLRGGAKARGVGIGATIAQIKAKFPKAKVDHSTDANFELTIVRIPKHHGGRMQFGVSTKTKRVTVMGVPFIAVCE